MAGMKSTKKQLLIFENAAALARHAAEQLSALARNSVASHGKFTVALSGGSTPRTMFSILAEEPLRSQTPWNSTFVFWSDERTVPPDHPDSNYRMAYEALISRVPLPAENVHRMRGESDPAKSADEYQAELACFFGTGWPRFDLVLLGMGDDGHTASLFPGTAALAIEDRQIAANHVPRLNTDRLTMTAPTINHAAAVWFLISGRSKAATLKEVLQGPRQPDLYPSQRIAPVDGELLWMTDRDAASGLSLPDAARLRDGQVQEYAL